MPADVCDRRPLQKGLKDLTAPLKGALSRDCKHSSGPRPLPGTIKHIGPEEYDELRRRVGAVVRDATPPHAVVAVVSKGDPHLIEIEGRTGLHFPRDAEGGYAGYHPKTSEDAVAQVESLRGAGAQFLCLPATALWWLDHYQGLAAWLNAHCRVAARDPETCVLYDLMSPPEDGAASTAAAGPVDRATAQVRSLLDALLPEEALLLVAGRPLEGLAAPGREVSRLPTGDVEGRRTLETLGDERPAFVLVAREGSAPPPDPSLESFLARNATAVARRENLCDLLQVSRGGNSSGAAQSPNSRGQK
jgi:hypothetical protein